MSTSVSSAGRGSQDLGTHTLQAAILTQTQTHTPEGRGGWGEDERVSRRSERKSDRLQRRTGKTAVLFCRLLHLLL